MSEVQKDLENISAGMDIKKNKVLNKFSCYLRSKSARSTLTSPGPIRVKELPSFEPYFADNMNATALLSPSGFNWGERGSIVVF
jgi:hypothetical protein